MAVTIERRLRRTVLAAILITFFVTAVSVLVANENLERAMLQLDFQSERELVLENARPNEILVWDNSMLKAYYVPPGMPQDERMPEIFRDLPVPYSGEFEVGDATFLMTADIVRGGRFFLAKDISLFESREEDFHRFLLFLGLAVVVLGFVLARLTGQRLVAPIRQLTDQIRAIAPAARMSRVKSDYQDAELEAIALSFNRFLGELETYVRREQSLTGLASHELRTPIAIIAGALDVIEQRGGMNGADKGPLIRMRRAVDEMTANIDVILKLTRRQSAVERRMPVDLADVLHHIQDDLQRQKPDTAQRMQIEVNARPWVEQDPALVQMLFRNLVQNAMQHTRGRVTVRLGSTAVDIEDDGPGLPGAYLAFLNDPQADARELLSLSGLGLFIVSLICERLSWTLQAVPMAGQGTTLRVQIKAGDGDLPPSPSGHASPAGPAA